jgi:hypothetical protein
MTDLIVVPQAAYQRLKRLVLDSVRGQETEAPTSRRIKLAKAVPEIRENVISGLDWRASVTAARNGAISGGIKAAPTEPWRGEAAGDSTPARSSALHLIPIHVEIVSDAEGEHAVGV